MTIRMGCNLKNKLLCLFTGHKFWMQMGNGRGLDKPMWIEKNCLRCHAWRSAW